MQPLPKCPVCGEDLPVNALAGHCPNCLLKLGVAPTVAGTLTSEDPALHALQGSFESPRSFGDYELLAEIARGGMGVVYKARQRSLDRVVALKMILSGQFASREYVQRFRAEASAAAILQHPNIVAIHEIGVQEGQHFFSMDYVQGRTLAEIVREGPLLPKRAATYLKGIAEAIHYAHGRGILHRDLKPSNVLIDAQDQPRITDFGLAKRLHGSSDLTFTGQMLGSPNYMPPEQAGVAAVVRRRVDISEDAAAPLGASDSQPARRLTTAATKVSVGPASDVYGLGAIFYHLLTGRPPFQGETMEQVLMQLREQEPVAPRLLNSSVPRDLETICLKCLEKDPVCRYRTAGELAEEFRRFLGDEPIQAHPPGQLEKAIRWCRRKPALAGALATVVLALLLGLSGVLWQSAARQRALNATRRLLYVAEINAAQAALQAGDISRTLSLLESQRPSEGEADLRGFEWHFLLGLCRSNEATILPGHDRFVQTLAVSPAGTVLATGGGGPRIRLWDLQTREEIPSVLTGGGGIDGLAFSPDGTLLAATDNGANFTLWELATQRAVARTTTGIRGWRMTFSPDGKRVALGNLPPATSAHVFEIPSLRLIAQIPDAVNPRPMLAYSSDGRWLAMGRADCSVHLLDAVTHQETATLTGHDQPVVDLAFSPDSRTLATASEDGTARLWDIATTNESGALIGHRRRVTSVAFSKDGQWLATGCIDGSIKIWDAKRRLELATLRGHGAWVGAVLFLPDGHTVASTSADNTTRLWELNGLLKAVGPQNDDGLARIAFFRPDGSALITGHDDGTVKIHYLDSKRPAQSLPPAAGPLKVIALTGDGNCLATASSTNLIQVIQVWELNSKRMLISTNLNCSGRVHLGFTWQGYHLIVFDGYELRANLELPARNQVSHARRAFEPVSSQALAAFGNVFSWTFFRSVPSVGLQAIAEVTEESAMIRAYPGERLVGRISIADGFGPNAISMDGRFTAVRGYLSNSLCVWDSRQQRQIIRSIPGTPIPDDCRGFQFSGDGSLLAVGTDTGQIHLLKSPRFESVGLLRGHKGWVTSIAFSPDGRTMATAGNDGEVKLWNLATLRELMTMPDPVSPYSNVSFSSDGHSLLCHGEDRRVRLWRVVHPEDQTDSPPSKNVAERNP